MGKTDVRQASRTDWIRAGHKMVEKDAETVDIALDSGLPPAQNLRRQVERRSGEIGSRIVRELASRAKVHQHDAPVLGSHHVVRLDVPMQQARAVYGGHRTTELEADVHRLSDGGLCRLLKDLLQGVAANELHPEADLVANLLGAMNGDHVGVAHAGEQAPFVDDRGRRAIAACAAGRQELERDFPIEPRVPRPVDFSKGAPANPLEEPKVTPPFSGFTTLAL